jgi:carbon-monoxide dehydrogenase medium subunit
MSFQYARPESIAELLALMREHGSEARILGGGTDLLVRLRKRRDTPRIVIDLKRIAELRSDITSTPNGVRVGGRAVMTDIIASPLVRHHVPALADAAITVGSVQIRNRATLAGNICNASPAADTAPVLLAYDAKVNLLAASGTRTIPLTEFFVGPGRTVLAADEIVESIDLPLPAPHSGTAFARLTRRRGVDLAIVSLCCHATGAGVVRFAFGAAGPRPFVVQDDTGILLDERTGPPQKDAVLRRLVAQAAPISDLRASDSYRAAMLLVLARRTLNAAIGRMQGQA